MSICLIVIAGLQSSSSFRIERQMVPDGYTFGWKSGGTNLHFGGFEGYSAENSMDTVERERDGGHRVGKTLQHVEMLEGSTARTLELAAFP